MKKIIILIPVYNDWDSLTKLIIEIEEQFKDKTSIELKFIIINDGSTSQLSKIKKPKNIKSIKIINMKKNRGHAKCIAYGIYYINQNEKFDNVILMDGDGEDRPEETIALLDKNFSEPKMSVVAKRVKRSEGPLFQFFYKMHKIVTFLFTGKIINFGNYSCLTTNDIKILVSKSSLWKSYSGTFKKNIKSFNSINSERGVRYFGPSKMSFLKLLLHSFSMIAVFKFQVFFRSILLIVLLIYSEPILGAISFLFQLILVFFNLTIFCLSLSNQSKELSFCQKNLGEEQEITN